MIAENRLLAKDQSKTLEERIANLKLAQALENATLLEQQENQAERVRIAEEEFERANSTAEDFKVLQEERARLIDLETDSFNRQRTIVSELESLKNQERKGSDEEEDRPLVRAIKSESAEYLEIVNDTQEEETRITENHIQKRLDNERIAAEQRIQLERQVQNAKLNIASNVFGLIGELSERGSTLAKTAAVAQATISGFQGVQNAFTTASASPITTLFPAYPFIQAGLAGAFSAVQIGKILSTDSRGGGSRPSGSVGGGSRGATSAPTVQAPDFNIVGSSSTNQLAQTISQQTQQPIKAFVTSNDVTTAQSLDRNIIDSASVG